MDHIEQTELKDTNLLFITPCKDFSLPDLSRTTLNTLMKGSNHQDTCSAIRFPNAGGYNWSSNIGSYFESDMKPMSPTKLANKRISLSPWANKNLYLHELCSRTPGSRNYESYQKCRMTVKKSTDLETAANPNHTKVGDKLDILSEDTIEINRRSEKNISMNVMPKIILNDQQMASLEQNLKIVENSQNTIQRIQTQSQKPHPINHVTANEMDMLDPS